MKEAIVEISECIYQYQQIDISKYDPTFLHNILKKRMSDLSYTNHTDYLKLITLNEFEQRYYLKLLQVSYTSFFRNSLTFSVLEKIILPELILSKRNEVQKEIRIWSAACAGGQEVYSLAILLHEIMADLGEDLKIRIFATDQSTSEIEFAQKGQYTVSAVANVSMKRLNNWFYKLGDSYCVSEQLKESIEFSEFDLLDVNLKCPPGSIFGDFDIVLCANLLFYYVPKIQGEIISKVSKSLKPTGFFVTGEVERDIMSKYNYGECYPQSAIFKGK